MSRSYFLVQLVAVNWIRVILQPLVVKPPFLSESCWRYRRVKLFLNQVSRIYHREEHSWSRFIRYEIPNHIQYHLSFLTRPHFASSIRFSTLVPAAPHTISHHDTNFNLQWRRSTRRLLSVESDIGSVCRICKDGVLVSSLPLTENHLERCTNLVSWFQ